MIAITAPEASSAPATARTCGITDQAGEQRDEDDPAIRPAAGRGSASRSPAVRLQPLDPRVDELREQRSRGTTTTARIVKRSQYGIGPSSSTPHSGRLPGEAVVVAVVPGDLVLAEPPAEQDRLAVAHRGEVDQAGVEILDEHAERLERRPAPRASSLGPPVRPRRAARRAPQAGSAAVPRDPAPRPRRFAPARRRSARFASTSARPAAEPSGSRAFASSGVKVRSRPKV